MEDLNNQQLHEVVDQLAPEHVDAMLAFAHVLNMDPVAQAVLFAPIDDEPLTEADRQRVERSLADWLPDISLEEMREELGL